MSGGKSLFWPQWSGRIKIHILEIWLSHSGRSRSSLEAEDTGLVKPPNIRGSQPSPSDWYKGPALQKQFCDLSSFPSEEWDISGRKAWKEFFPHFLAPPPPFRLCQHTHQPKYHNLHQWFWCSWTLILSPSFFCPIFMILLWFLLLSLQRVVIISSSFHPRNKRELTNYCTCGTLRSLDERNSNNPERSFC